MLEKGGGCRCNLLLMAPKAPVTPYPGSSPAFPGPRLPNPPLLLHNPAVQAPLLLSCDVNRGSVEAQPFPGSGEVSPPAKPK